MLKIKLPARIESLDEFMSFVSAQAAERGFLPKRIKKIELAVEEALVNIFNHAYPQGKGEVELRWMPDVGARGHVIEIEDAGRPFDVLSVPEPDLGADLAGRRVGGLGIFFMKKMVEDVTYKREGEKNILTLVLGSK